MPHIPTKRCDRIDRHEWPDGHAWKEGAFKRWCPGRPTAKLPSRNVRRREAKKAK